MIAEAKPKHICHECPAYTCAECPRQVRVPMGESNNQARWKRRYPSLGAWLAAHAGEAAGILYGQPEVRYYWGVYNSTKVYHSTVRPGKVTNEVSRTEFFKGLGCEPLGPRQGPLPTWPPIPEVWGKRRNGKPVNGRPGDDLLRRYADYAKLVRGVGMTPRPFEDWAAKLKT